MKGGRGGTCGAISEKEVRTWASSSAFPPASRASSMGPIALYIGSLDLFFSFFHGCGSRGLRCDGFALVVDRDDPLCILAPPLIVGTVLDILPRSIVFALAVGVLQVERRVFVVVIFGGVTFERWLIPGFFTEQVGSKGFVRFDGTGISNGGLVVL